MQQQHDLSERPSYREQYAAFVSWLALLCQTLETSIAVFTRRGFGRRYLGGQAMAVFPVVLVFSMFWEGHDVRPLIWFLGAYLLACACARVSSNRRARRGEIQHSHYSGTPVILRWRIFRGWLSERAAKSIVEPIVVAAVGYAVAPLNEPLGMYLVTGAVGSVLAMGFARGFEAQRLMDTRDAYLEQQYLAERFRDGGC